MNSQLFMVNVPLSTNYEQNCSGIFAALIFFANIISTNDNEISMSLIKLIEKFSKNNFNFLNISIPLVAPSHKGEYDYKF